MPKPMFKRTLRGVERTDCLQVALSTALGIDRPIIDFITSYKEGRLTWPHPALCILNKLGYYSCIISDFNYGALHKDGGEYLIKRYGGEIAEVMMAKSDVDYAANWAYEAREIHVHRPAELQDIKIMKSIGYELIVGVRGNHYDYVSDSYLTDIANNEEEFLKEWSIPTERDRGLICVRRK